jgi:hypothetical protein
VTRPEAAKLVAVIIAACPAQGSKLDRERQLAMVDAFEALLGDLEYTHAAAAVRVLLQTRTWMPSVADIRATVVELERGPVRAGGDAWGGVLAAMKREGAYREPGTDFVFRDPVTMRCVQRLGWQELCLSENTIADRARFIQLYDELAQQARKEQASPMLAAAEERRREVVAAGDAVARVLTLAKGVSGGE